jgi:type I restriction enzyme S subunit
MTGAANMSISIDRLATVPIEFPPLTEQERIVKLLDEVDELRKLRGQVDQRTEALIPALFHDMFGDPEHTRLPVRPLVELVLPERPVTYGILKPGPDIEDGVPYVRVLDIKKGHLDVHQLRKTTKQIAEQYRRSILKPGDILVTIRGTVGRTCIVPGELNGANITQDTARLAIIPSIHATYVVEFLNTPWAQSWMSRHMLGQAVKGLNLGDLRKLPVPVPPLPFQQDFAQRVSEIREMEAAQTASRGHLANLFQSMLHEAFNGDFTL